ncbi:MAG: GGDEF domain-containing protein [Planctomycetes bacterium]|nr:GGDEF domain-containing protein [Planctomycetota bacterium]
MSSNWSSDTSLVRPAHKARIGPVVHYTTYVGILAHAGFIPLFAWLDVPFMAWFNVLSVATWVFARYINDRGRGDLAVTLITVEICAHAILAVNWIGWASGFHYYLLPLIPVMMFNDQWRTLKAVAVCVAVAVAYALLNFGTRDGPWLFVNVQALRVVHDANVMILLVALLVISLFFRFASETIEHRMEDLAMTDVLTGLPNRRKMRVEMDKEASRLARTGQCAAVVIADIDHFKRINDTWGHESGDHVLRGLALLLGANLRSHDALARWGGEEFLFLLPDTDIDQAVKLAERMRAAVEKASFGPRRLLATMTFGVALLDAHSPVEACIRDADRALYRGKFDGRNRVVKEERPAPQKKSPTAQSNPHAQPVS